MRLAKSIYNLHTSYSSGEALHKIPVLECISQVVCGNEFFRINLSFQNNFS